MNCTCDIFNACKYNEPNCYHIKVGSDQFNNHFDKQFEYRVNTSHQYAANYNQCQGENR